MARAKKPIPTESEARAALDELAILYAAVRVHESTVTRYVKHCGPLHNDELYCETRQTIGELVYRPEPLADAICSLVDPFDMPGVISHLLQKLDKRTYRGAYLSFGFAKELCAILDARGEGALMQVFGTPSTGIYKTAAKEGQHHIVLPGEEPLKAEIDGGEDFDSEDLGELSPGD